MHGACPEAYVALAEYMAERARTIIRPLFRSRVDIEHKSDLSPVTAADRRTEAALRRMIAEHYPEHGVIGEEYGTDRGDAEFVWVLDPVDGTMRFITGNPLFGTLIALVQNGRPILGVIDIAMLDERWVGAAGRPTLFRNSSGDTEARVRPCEGLSAATLTATSPHMFEGAASQAFERVRGGAKIFFYGGECYSYALLASGFLDVVIEADMGIHDYLAMVPVIEGAGGVLSDWQGAPLGLQSGDRLVASGDPRVHDETLALLGSE